MLRLWQDSASRCVGARRGMTGHHDDAAAVWWRGRLAMAVNGGGNSNGSLRPAAGDGRLRSWKEIASYFGADERTVKRWEVSRGLPVHRVPGGARAPGL